MSSMRPSCVLRCLQQTEGERGGEGESAETAAAADTLWVVRCADVTFENTATQCSAECLQHRGFTKVSVIVLFSFLPHSTPQHTLTLCRV